MPTFIYSGQADSLRVHGKSLVRGRPTELTGAAADAAAGYAAKHSDLEQVENAPKSSKGSTSALAERQALVARAKELGLSAKGKSADLAAAIAEVEAKG